MTRPRTPSILHPERHICDNPHTCNMNPMQVPRRSGETHATDPTTPVQGLPWKAGPDTQTVVRTRDCAPRAARPGPAPPSLRD